MLEVIEAIGCAVLIMIMLRITGYSPTTPGQPR
jgi:hypothetical protein